MKVDSGAETNVIPTKTWYKIANRPKLKMNRTKLRAFGNTEIPHEGVATVPISIGERQMCYCVHHKITDAEGRT